MGRKIAIIIFVVIIIALFVYVISSGVFNGIFNSLVKLAPSHSTTSATSTKLQHSNVTESQISNGSPVWRANISTSTGNNILGVPSNTTTTIINPSDIPAGYTISQLSPFFHKITFGVIYGGSLFNSYGQISLYDNDNSNGSIDVTGWEIKSNTNSEKIPTAINLYDPSGFTAPTDIIMKQGQTLNIYSDTSPFNLRLNKCTGYLQNDNQFNPALPLDCPYPLQSDISSFTGPCQQYIYSLYSCAVPDLNNISIPQTDYACRNYLENLNYAGCYKEYSSSPDFLSDEWRVWTGASIVSSLHDTVSLFDRKGLLVDLRIY